MAVLNAPLMKEKIKTMFTLKKWRRVNNAPV